jgi:hypothetical protein
MRKIIVTTRARKNRSKTYHGDTETRRKPKNKVHRGDAEKIKVNNLNTEDTKEKQRRSNHRVH